ncbi:hypothetical protein R3P38DRAFT_2780298 [Favolaschia claudopus]|uniref:Uncharacterized protein n=1 Tax=Favolaschia claudopus TaxID=2862362 RepID=A0AAW0BAG1_9AGAR
MAKMTKPPNKIDDSPSEDEDFRPTRKTRKSLAAKQATAEARKQRRREYYAREYVGLSFFSLFAGNSRTNSAVKIRAKNRIHIAERRAAAKKLEQDSIQQNIGSQKASDLAAAELLASETLAQMRAARAAQENFSKSPTLRARESEEQELDREISNLFEAGKHQDDMAESSDEDEEAAAQTMILGSRLISGDSNREMAEKSHALKAARLRLLEAMGPRYSSRKSPSPDPPSPGRKRGKWEQGMIDRSIGSSDQPVAATACISNTTKWLI